MKIPILADTNHAVSRAYGCLKEDEGIAFRGLYIIDGKGNIFNDYRFVANQRLSGRTSRLQQEFDIIYRF